MEALFGVSTALIARALAIVTAALLLGAGALAWRRRVLLRLGLRNALRRPVRSLVIVIGVMLSTVVIATAFTTGDAMTLTIRSLVTGSVGRVDEVVTNTQTDFTQVSSRDLGNLLSGGSAPQQTGDFFAVQQFAALRDGV